MTSVTHPPATPGSFSRAGVALVCAGVVLLIDGGILLLLNPPSYVFWLIDLGLLLVAAGILGMVLLPESRPDPMEARRAEGRRNVRSHRPGVAVYREPVEYVLPLEEIPPRPASGPSSRPWTLPNSMTRPMGASAAPNTAGETPAAPSRSSASALPPPEWAAPAAGWDPARGIAGLGGPVTEAAVHLAGAVSTGAVASRPTAPIPATALTPLAARLSEVPNPPSSPRGSFAINLSCSACGTSLVGSIVPPMCWGCGRPLCNGCFWHPVASGTPHHCPTCAVPAPSTSPTFALSGGRAGRA